MKKAIAFLSLFIFSAITQAEQLCNLVEGATLIAQDGENTYLGKLGSKYDSDSVFNNYGTYGSEYSAESIWNKYGQFGGKYSTYSVFNQYTSTPPMIIKNKQIIGYLSANKAMANSVSPNLLKAVCGE
ncbi:MULTISPECIES: hypothetical protein [Shewanella]|jgi:hypothetical protein|uniref:Uncharacterized protein n=2 Tax=Shewanella TaxID=22 RepID=A9L1Y9_SHEB9|nr:MULTISPECIES: hypothetical protein [Shewanella]ABX49407.1 conserved hypothetical protein [Shewanella baltica OS195]ADT94403.1 hypothetical protein Sbal678_2247 [Shewanella baltica OS678]MDT3282945.1 hypothetical protein [Shewanella sp. SP2S1-2]